MRQLGRLGHLLNEHDELNRLKLQLVLRIVAVRRVVCKAVGDWRQTLHNVDTGRQKIILLKQVNCGCLTISIT